MRTHDRLDRAISRACGRYFHPFYFCAGNGARLRIDAVKRTVGAEELDALGGSATARLVEFVVSRATFERMKRAAVAGLDAGGFAQFRNATIEERVETETRVYAVSPKRPFDENSPDAGTARVFTTLIRNGK